MFVVGPGHVSCAAVSAVGGRPRGYMNKVLIVEKPIVVVWVYPELRLIHHVMKAFCHGVEWRDVLMKCVDTMKSYKATKWLSDDRANGAVMREDQEWADREWFPKVRAAGWKHWAIVQPEKVIGQINMGRLTQKYLELGINARMFSDPDEAMTWIVAA
jgi:hypothetical protein